MCCPRHRGDLDDAQSGRADAGRSVPHQAGRHARGRPESSRDETITGDGCEAGDLTKRMAIPWQADFFDCTVQDVNFTTSVSNKAVSNMNMIPLAPTFYAYW